MLTELTMRFKINFTQPVPYVLKVIAFFTGVKTRRP